MKRSFALSALAAVCLAATTGCSQADEAPDRREAMAASPASAAPAGSAVAEAAAAQPSIQPAAAAQAGSRVLGKKALTLRGAPACEVRFVYAGREAETLIREEPCAAVTATMLTQQELEALGRWDRLDSFARKFVNALPDGRVLYVEGSFSASVYPVGTTGSTYEVPVAD